MDHSLLGIDANIQDAEKYAKEVINYNLRGTCSRPHHVNISSDILKGTSYKNASVLVFPTKKCKTIEEMISNRKELYLGSQSLSDTRKKLIDIC